MFRFKTRERRIFTNRKRVRSNFSGFWAIVSVALMLLVLELLTRIAIDISGNRSKFTQETTESEITQAYHLRFVAADFPVKPPQQENVLRAKPALSVGYQLLSNQQNKYWNINAAGFRDRDPVSEAKPKDEIRIFILGGSTAFGYGASSNATTISEYLEQRLAQRLQQQKTSPQLYQPNVLPFEPEQKAKSLAKPAKIKPGNYRVINAAVPGYTSGNQLAQMAWQILKHKPDLIVTLNGYGDLMLPSSKEAVQVPQLKYDFNDQQTSFTKYISQLIQPLEAKSYLVKVAQTQWLNNRQTDDKADFLLYEETSQLVEHLPPNEAELQKRIDRYLDHQKQILNLSAAARVPLVVAMQPEITGRNPSQLTDTEGEIASQLGRTYIKKVRADYPIMIRATQKLAQIFPQNMKAVDLYKLTERYPSPSFIDAIHLNDTANQKVAEQLYYAISSLPKMQTTPKEAKPPTTKPSISPR